MSRPTIQPVHLGVLTVLMMPWLVRWILVNSAERADAAAVVFVAVTWGCVALGVTWCLRQGTHGLPGLLALALATRLPLVGTPWLLSDDAWRYLFEGRVLALGINPFLHAPATLAPLLPDVAAQVNHPDVPTIYPPTALAWFRLLDWIGSPSGAQLLTLLADLGALAVLFGVLGQARRPTWPALLYALHPLPALESAGSAHLESLALLFAGLGLLAWSGRRPALAWLGLGLGAGVKLLPALALPALLRTRDWRQSLAGGALTLGVCVLLALPVLDAGTALFATFGNYASHWSFNGLVHPWLTPLGLPARPLLVTGAAVACAWGAWTLRDPLQLLAWVGAVFVCTSPTVHPWYLMWALWPSLALARWSWAAAAVPMLGAYAVLRTVDDSGTWTEPAWLWWVTWPPAGAVFWLFRTRADNAAPPTTV